MYFDQVANQLRLEPDGTLSELTWRDGERRFVPVTEGSVAA